MRDVQIPEEPDMSWANKKVLPVRWLLTLISVVMMGIGLWSVFTGEFFGGTTRSGAEVHLTGSKAIWMGLSMAALGAFPLGMWGTNKKAVVLGMCVPFAFFVVFLIAAITL
jgi:hypothetical protein